MGRSVPTACLFLLACPVVTSIWVQTARPCKVHPGGGAVVTIYGTGFRPTFSSPEPVVYIGPDTRNTYIHPQYTRRLSNETIEIAAPITGWGLSGAMSAKVRVVVGPEEYETSVGFWEFTCSSCSGTCPAEECPPPSCSMAQLATAAGGGAAAMQMMAADPKCGACLAKCQAVPAAQQQACGMACANDAPTGCVDKSTCGKACNADAPPCPTPPAQLVFAAGGGGGGGGGTTPGGPPAQSGGGGAAAAAACTIAQVMSVSAAPSAVVAVMGLLSSAPACGGCLMTCATSANPTACAMKCAGM